MKTRLLFAIGGMYGGGSERRTLGMLQALERDRYEPELYLVAGRGELFSQIPADVPVHIFERRVPRKRYWLPGAAFRARVRDLADVLAERNIDVLCDRTYHMTLITAGAVRRRPTARISIIVSQPEADFETNVERFRWYKRRLLRAAYRDATVTAAVSEGVKASAAAYHQLDPTRIEVFHNFYDVERIQMQATEPLPVEWNKPEGRQRIVAVGRLHEAKAYDVLIESIRRLVREDQLTEVELLIAGTGPLETELRRQIEHAQLQNHITLTGYLDNPLPLVASADVFCLSSRYEGMPNSLAEAALCGVPVVSTDCPHGPAEILEQGRWGALVPAEDPVALADALAGALAHQEPFKKRAATAREVIADRYSLTTGLTRFDELVKLAQGRGSVRHSP